MQKSPVARDNLIVREGRAVVKVGWRDEDRVAASKFEALGFTSLRRRPESGKCPEQVNVLYDEALWIGAFAGMMD